MSVTCEGFEEEVARSWALNRGGQEEEALAIVRALVERCPDDPRAHFEFAGALDYQGRELEAVAPYRQAQSLGLSGSDLPRLYVQLGSTLRNVGEFNEALEFLQEGRTRFPDHAAIRAFHALALLSASRCSESVISLLDVIVAHADAIGLDGYERALRAYTDELRSQPAENEEPIEAGNA
jgi:tetratricopeptide (TPR) repeat protein